MVQQTKGLTAGQTKKMSLLETVTGTAIGFVVAVLTQLVVFPLFGLQATYTEQGLIALIFTVVSLIRSYFVRRLFNWWHIRQANSRV